MKLSFCECIATNLLMWMIKFVEMIKSSKIQFHRFAVVIQNSQGTSIFYATAVTDILHRKIIIIHSEEVKLSFSSSSAFPSPQHVGYLCM